MRLFGMPVPARLPDVIGRIGALVEAPKFSPHFTGRQNLLLLAKAAGVGSSRADAALEAVDLRNRGADPYKSYSLGMRQRLAIGAALLRSPHLLILDEPTNGLDPSGIREVRELIASFGEQGVTVLLSSHVLAEVEQVCSSVTIIGNGRTLARGRVSELLAVGGTTYRVGVTNNAAAMTALGNAGLSASMNASREYLLVEAPSPELVVEALAASAIGLTELTILRRDLESLFLELTAGDSLGHEGRFS